MSAEILRQAAALMRERAEAASCGEWRAQSGVVISHATTPLNVKYICDCFDEPGGSIADAAHIASWHPAAALAVADLFVRLADRADAIADTIGSERVAKSVIESNLVGYVEALTAARVYLGESA